MKEERIRSKNWKRLLKSTVSICLSLALILGGIPGIPGKVMEAYAGTETYTALIPTGNESEDQLAAKQVIFNGKPWYIIADNSTGETEGTLTLLAADTSFGVSKFSDGDNRYCYKKTENYMTTTVNSAIKALLDNLVYQGTFSSVGRTMIYKTDTNTDTEIGYLYLLSETEAQSLPENVRKLNFTGGNCTSGEWWLRTASGDNTSHKAVYVNGSDGTIVSGNGDDSNVAKVYGVRPAVDLNLSEVRFNKSTKTFSILIKYNLYVGGTMVTEENKDNIPATNGTSSGKASYDPDTDTLTLDNYSFSGTGYNSVLGNSCIFSALDDTTFSIVLKGTNQINMQGEIQRSALGIGNNLSSTPLNISGTSESDKLIIVTPGSQNNTYPEGRYGIICSGSAPITITNCTIESTANSVNTNGINNSQGLTSSGNISISGSRITTSGYSYGIKGANIIIDNASTVTAINYGTGENHKAVSGTVKTLANCEGWTTSDMSDNAATITTGTDGFTIGSSYKAVRFTPSHNHSFTYTAGTGADANKITAVCSADDCPLPLNNSQHTATLTISAPLHTNYGDGNAATAVITDLNSIQGNAAVSYYAAENGQKTGDALGSAPENVGTYWAEITLGEGNGAATAHVLYSIDKALPTELTPSDAETYSGISYLLETVSPTDGYEVSSSNTEYSQVTSLTAILDGSDNPVIYVRRAETADTAAGAWVAVTLTARPSAPTGLTVKSYAESSTSQGTVTVPATDDSTKIEYKLDDSNVTTWTETSRGDLSLDPGTYLFRIKATASVPAGKTTSVEVGVKTDMVLPDAPADGSTVYLKYTGEEQKLLNITIPNEYTGCTIQTKEGEADWANGIPYNPNEGTFPIQYRILGGAKYKDFGPRQVTVIISSRVPLDSTSTPLKIKKGDAVLGDTVPVVGDTLNADCSATDLLYQWYRDGEPISEATSETYTLTKEDYGKTITVQVTQTKDVSGDNYAEGQRPTLTSAATKAVTAPVGMGGKGYQTIAEALQEANGEETIVLNKAANSDVSIANGKNIILDLHGCTLIGNVENRGNLTIMDSSGNSGRLPGTIQTFGGNTVIESGRFDNIPWDAQESGTVIVKGGYFKDGVSTGMIAGDDYEIEEYESGKTFTPAWADTNYKYRVVEISSYTVVFDSNGGSGKMADQTVSRNVATRLNANAFTNDGYVFTGWNTKKDGSGTSYKDKAEVTLKENLTLYAQWEESKNHNHLPLKEVPETEPKCEEEGNKHYYECETCGKIFEDAFGQVELTRDEVILKAIGHNWNSGEVTKEPTYYEDGIKTYTCLNDPSHTKEEIIPKKIRSYDSSSSDSDSDDSGSGSSSSSTTKAESQSKADQVNNVSSFQIPENHQVESGLPLSDIGGNWGNSVNADTWTYTKSDGTLAKGEWLNLEYNGLRYWYYFNDDGNMHTNWFDYNNERFYLMPDKDGWRGRMATGWKNIENKWYYFDIVPGSSQGRLYRSTVTPDGHIVGADGVWNGIGATPVGQE